MSDNSLDYLLNTKASFDIAGANAFSTNVQTFTIPSIYGYVAEQPTPMASAPLVGNKAIFGYIDISFLVTENMQSYLEIYNWMMGIYAPIRSEQFKNKRLYMEQASLTTYTSANNPYMRISLVDCFPVKIDEITFNTQAIEAEPIKCKVSFAFLRHDISLINTI
jgi:hypothetical protein